MVQSLCIECSVSCASANSVRVRVEEVMLRWRMQDDSLWESWFVVILCWNASSLGRSLDLPLCSSSAGV